MYIGCLPEEEVENVLKMIKPLQNCAWTLNPRLQGSQVGGISLQKVNVTFQYHKTEKIAEFNYTRRVYGNAK